MNKTLVFFKKKKGLTHVYEVEIGSNNEIMPINESSKIAQYSENPDNMGYPFEVMFYPDRRFNVQTESHARRQILSHWSIDTEGGLI